MKLKILLYILVVIIFLFTLSGCTYLQERLLNNEPLYGGGQIKNTDDINIIKDIGLYTYEENFDKVLDNSISPASVPSFYDNYHYAIFDELGLQYDSLKTNIFFDTGNNYSDLDGVLTYLGGNYRNNASFAYPSINNKKLNLLWQFSTSNIDNFYGTGWTGQSVVIHWSIETQTNMNMYHSYKTSNGTIEVITGSLDGYIYFTDLYTGKPTRDPLNIGLPIFGSISVDPRGYPLLYVGTGFNLNGQRYEDMKFSIISLIDGEILYQINGSDPYALRSWGAFDSSPLIDKNSDSLIIGSENGLLYYLKMNTEYNQKEGTISINPDIYKYYYTNPFGKNVGFESSLAAFKNYIYITDNGGLLQCIDASTMTPIWIYDLKDDSDSTISLDVISNNEVYLYTATEIVYEKDSSLTYIRKINALSGELIWENKFKCTYSEEYTTGVTGSPILGLSTISNSVIYSVTGLGENGNESSLISFAKSNGEIFWQTDELDYSISSPIAIYDKDGTPYIIMSYSNGKIDLLNSKSGVVLYTLQLNGIIESTPVIYNGLLVIGTRSGNVYCIRIN